METRQTAITKYRERIKAICDAFASTYFPENDRDIMNDVEVMKIADYYRDIETIITAVYMKIPFDKLTEWYWYRLDKRT